MIQQYEVINYISSVRVILYLISMLYKTCQRCSFLLKNVKTQAVLKIMRTCTHTYTTQHFQSQTHPQQFIYLNCKSDPCYSRQKNREILVLDQEVFWQTIDSNLNPQLIMIMMAISARYKFDTR